MKRSRRRTTLRGHGHVTPVLAPHTKTVVAPLQPGRAWLGGLLLLVVTLLTYLPAMRCGFIWDDDAYVQQNHTLRTLDGLRRIWFEPRSTPQYYPPRLYILLA